MVNLTMLLRVKIKHTNLVVMLVLKITLTRVVNKTKGGNHGICNIHLDM
jgi:hypothetical protein